MADGVVFIRFLGIYDGLSLTLGIAIAHIKVHGRLFASVSYVMF